MSRVTHPESALGRGAFARSALSPPARSWWLAAVLVLAIAIRASVLVPALSHAERSLRPDSDGYLVLAESISEGHGLSFEEDGRRLPSIARTPGYPAFLAAIGAKRDHYLHAIPLQLLLDLAVLAIVFVTARQLADDRAALLAAAAYALGMTSAVSAAYIMSDTVFAALVAAQMYFGVRYARRGRLLDGASSSALLAIGMLTRPIGLVLVPAFAVLLLAGARRTRRMWPHTLSCCLVLALIVGPWVARNERITGAYMLSSMGDYNLLAYNAAAIEARVTGADEGEVSRELVTRYMNARDSTALESARSAALEIIRKHPLAYAELHLKDSLLNLLPDVSGLLEMWGLSSGERGTKSLIHAQGLVAGARYYFRGHWRAAIALAPWCIIDLLIWPLASIGAVRMWRRGDRSAAAASVLAVGALVLTPGPASHPRFSVPALPWVAFALAGIVHLPALQGDRSNESRGGPGAIS